MISNENASIADALNGKRHFFPPKRTSLFGSESPRKPNNNLKSRPNLNEENILTQYEILRRDRELDENKKMTLQATENYNPWGKTSMGTGNTHYASEQNEIRDKWDYEREMKATNDEKPISGFAAGFGAGNTRNYGRQRSAASSNNNDGRQNLFYPFGSPGGGAPISEDSKKSHGATVTLHRNPISNVESERKLDESKIYADQLEQEIQKMRLKQMEDRYSSIKSDLDDVRNERFENNSNCEYESNALYQEAENRARLRELDRLRDTYDSLDNNKYRANDKNDTINERDNILLNTRNNEMSSGPLQLSEPKRIGSSSTHNDYRQYSLDEFVKSRQQMVNPVQLKRTTLCGSEDINQIDGYPIDNDSYGRFRPNNGTNTYNNIFPSEKNESDNKANRPYSTKAPWATD